MSGGAMDYAYHYIEEVVGMMGDPELDDLMRDIATLLHDREWYLSGDDSESSWAETACAFKGKWLLKGARDARLAGHIEEIFKEAKDKCVALIGGDHDDARRV